MDAPRWLRASNDHFTTTWNGQVYTLYRRNFAEWWLHKGHPYLEPTDYALDGAWRNIPDAQAGAALWLNGWRIDPPCAEDGTVLYRRGDERRPYKELRAEINPA